MYLIVRMKEKSKCVVLHGKYMQVLEFSPDVASIIQPESAQILCCVNLSPSWSSPFNINANNLKVTWTRAWCFSCAWLFFQFFLVGPYFFFPLWARLCQGLCYCLFWGNRNRFQSKSDKMALHVSTGNYHLTCQAVKSSWLETGEKGDWKTLKRVG